MRTLRIFNGRESLTFANASIRESICKDRGEKFLTITYKVDGYTPSKPLVRSFFTNYGPTVDTLVEEDENLYSLGVRRIHGLKSTDNLVTLELE